MSELAHKDKSTRTGELACTGELARIEGLTISFPGRAEPAVNNVSLTISAGECVALVGESGSGKTLTARTLLGLLPHTAQVEGAVQLSGAIAPQRGSAAWNALRGTRVALVPQEALSGLDPLRRVEHEVGDTLRLHRLASGAERRRRVVSALANVGMPKPEQQLRRRSDELSGGLRQRALVASALIAEPELIVADEPTTALDAGHRGRVLAEIRRRVDGGAGALLISHDLASVRGVADRVIVMRDGHIVEQGDPIHVLTAPEHPFTRELLAASPAGKPRGERLLTSMSEGEKSTSTAVGNHVARGEGTVVGAGVVVGSSTAVGSNPAVGSSAAPGRSSVTATPATPRLDCGASTSLSVAAPKPSGYCAAPPSLWPRVRPWGWSVNQGRVRPRCSELLWACIGQTQATCASTEFRAESCLASSAASFSGASHSCPRIRSIRFHVAPQVPQS